MGGNPEPFELFNTGVGALHYRTQTACSVPAKPARTKRTTVKSDQSAHLLPPPSTTGLLVPSEVGGVIEDKPAYLLTDLCLWYKHNSHWVSTGPEKYVYLYSPSDPPGTVVDPTRLGILGRSILNDRLFPVLSCMTQTIAYADATTTDIGGLSTGGAALAPFLTQNDAGLHRVMCPLPLGVS